MVPGEIEDNAAFLGGVGGGEVEKRFIMGDMQMVTPRRVIVKYSQLVNRNNCNNNNIIKALRH